MAMPPMPPPEAEALRIARIRQHLSVREAAQRAGVSASLWRQVEAGYMTPVKGVHTLKIAPAATLARMALAVDLQAEHLDSQGQRPDAAEILREIIRQQGDSRTAAPEPPPRDRHLAALEDSDEPGLRPYIQGTLRDLYQAAGIMPSSGPGRELPGLEELPEMEKLLDQLPGSRAFTADYEQAAWDTDLLTPAERVRLIARLRRLTAEAMNPGIRDAV